MPQVTSIVCVFVFLSCCSFGQSPVTRDAPDYTRRYKESVSAASLEAINTVDDSTAIALEFLRMKRTIREDRIGSRGDRFIGFLTGRAKVALPKWWLELLQDGVVHENGEVSFASRQLQGIWSVDDDVREWEIDEQGLWNTNDQGWKFSGVSDLIGDGDRLTLSDGDTVAVTLIRKDFEEWLYERRSEWKSEADETDNGDQAMAAYIGGDFFAVALQCSASTSPGGPSHIVFGDSATGKPRWSHPLSEGVVEGGWQGSFDVPFTEVFMDDNSVFVFSSHGGVGISFHGFDKKTGNLNVCFLPALLEGLSIDVSGAVVRE